MSWLLANSMVAGVLSLLVLLIARWWKPAPAVMHGLWLVVVLKLVTPPLFEVPLDLSWVPSSSRPSAPAAAEVPASGSTAAIVAAPIATRPPVASPIATSPDTASVATASVPGQSTPSRLWLWLWLGTSSLLLLVTARRLLGMHRAKLAFGPVPIGLRLEVRELAERIGVAPPELCDDPQATAPYVWTIGRTRLVLPVALLQSCTKKGRAAVIAHELAHLHRLDHWVARCELVLLTLLWWHPLFWFARSRMRLWAELACDAIAINTVPDANLDYATLLVDAAARPLPTHSGVAVLASRPAARAAFERRLKMILNENLPRRASRAWCVPFAALTLGLFAVPVAAQEQDPEPVRVEIRVNGKPVKNLSSAQREALLKVLIDDPAPAKSAAAKQDKREPRRVRIRRRDGDDQQPRRRKGYKKLQDTPNAADIQGALRQGLAEARREIQGDPDLKELGITDEVLHLIDGVANGEGIESSLDGVVKAALKGAGKLALKEIHADEDLRRLGLDKGIAKFVSGLLNNEANTNMLGELARTAIGAAIEEAKHEIRNDADLQELGIADDVEGLIGTLLSGDGDFESDLNQVIQQAMKAVSGEIERATPSKKKSTKGKVRRLKRRQRETIR